MWIFIPKRAQLINLEQYNAVRIDTVNEEKGLYELGISQKRTTGWYVEPLISPCSRKHAEKQLTNILRSLSNGVKICRVYDEDEPITPNEENTT